MRKTLSVQVQTIVDGLWPGAVVRRTVRLRGGIDTTAHLVTVEVEGNRRQLVLKRYRSEQATVVARTAMAMTHASAGGVNAPEPVWVDADGEMFGVPALLYGFEPGKTTFRGLDHPHKIRLLAEALARVHRLDPIPGAESVSVPGAVFVETFQCEWGDDALGAVVADALRGRAPRRQRHTLLHGDFYPANVAWSAGAVSAVLDWDAVRVGPPEFDVAYCRLHLQLVHGAEVGEQFVAFYESAAGPLLDLDFWDLCVACIAVGRHPFWLDLYAAGGVEVEWKQVRAGLEAFVERARSAGERHVL